MQLCDTEGCTCGCSTLSSGKNVTPACDNCTLLMHARLQINEAEELVSKSLVIDQNFPLNTTLNISGKDLSVAQLKDLNQMLKKDTKKLNEKMQELKRARARLAVLKDQLRQPMSIYQRDQIKLKIFAFQRKFIPNLRKEIYQLKKDIEEERSLLDEGMRRYVARLRKG